eukprot:gene17022-20239_t
MSFLRNITSTGSQVLVGGALVGSLGWAIDTQLNDDWDVIQNQYFRRSPNKDGVRQRLVVLGSGWASSSFLRTLDTNGYDVTVVSPRNYFTFTPLLPSTTVGTVELRSVIEPVRAFYNRFQADDVRYLQAECTDIDHKRNKIKCKAAGVVRGDTADFEVEYDQLVITVGAKPATFGIPGVAEHGFFLKEVQDARAIRNRIVDCLETASIPGQSPETKKRLLHFVIVGGGPTGVEFSAELHDFLRSDVAKKSFPDMDKECVRISLYEAMPQVLNMFEKQLVQYTEDKFKREGINVHTNTAVIEVGDTCLKTKRKEANEIEEVPYGMLVWVAGIRVQDVAEQFKKALGQQGRSIEINEYCRVKDTQNVWAIGDCTFGALPPTAQVASQQGKYLGRLFNNFAGSSPQALDMHSHCLSQEPFQFKNRGAFAYIGGSQAILQTGSSENPVVLGGHEAYFAYKAAYFSKLLGLRNRLMVGTDWFKTQVFGRDPSRV